MKNILITFLIAISFNAAAQKETITLKGTVRDASGEAAIGIAVFLEGTSKGAVTDVGGNYIIQDIPAGNYLLKVSGIGYEKISKPIRLGGVDALEIDFDLKSQAQELDELVVYGKSEATKLREQAYAVEVVEAKGFKNLSTNANDILGRIAGVNIRQSGGLGSDFSLSLNGLTDNQVRIFLDGVPMDYFGTSLSLNNFSANLIERIEVYKGVVPIHLSSDALGGAINIVTGKKLDPYLDVSYSTGSFGTHVASLNTQYRSPLSGFTLRLKSFYNTAENNYKVPIRLVNFETGKEDDFDTEVERFHDAYNSKMFWLETGVTGTKYADQLLVGILYSDNYNEIQQPENAIGQAKIPFGEVSREEEKIIANFSYSKSGLLKDRLGLNAYFVGVFAESTSKDTSSYRYDWFGNKYPRTDQTTGEVELRKTFLQLQTDNYLGNFNAEYALAARHNLALNYSLNHLQLRGADDFKEENNTQFSNPSTVTKHVMGMAYTQGFLNDRLKNTFFSKLYNYNIQSQETNYSGDQLEPFTESRDNVGFGISSTYQFKTVQVKASFENATRFPEVIELFGDGLNNKPNPTLGPERSNNYNLGVIYTGRSVKYPVSISINGFIRDSEDFIIPDVRGNDVYRINFSNVLTRGVDVASSYNFKNRLILTLNGTYLDQIDNNKWQNGVVGMENPLYQARIPNVPYLFGNLTVSYRKRDLFQSEDTFSVTLLENYVHDFFYGWEEIGDQNKRIVPTQWTTNLEFVYSLKNEKYNASAGVSNLWDAEVYDNFLQLRPGRAFNVKLRCFLK